MRLVLVALFILIATIAEAQDWTQLQGNAARSGYTPDEIIPTPNGPGYKARWMWFGPTTLRNQASTPEAGDAPFTNDLTARDGYDFPMPASAPFTLAGTTQPVIAGGRVFIGDQEGNCYALKASDGSTVWTQPNPGGTLSAGAVVGNTVVFVTLFGQINGFDTATGTPRFSVKASKAIWSAPLAVGTRVYAASLDGKVYCVDTANGTLAWTSAFLGAPIAGGLASDGTSLFVGTENMKVQKLDLSSGAVQATSAVIGSSFRMLWPVVNGGNVYVRTCGANCIGSEYVMENVMTASTGGVAAEEPNIVKWLKGDTSGGQFADASPDWQTLFILNAATLAPSSVDPPAVGPTEGTGHPPEPPCLDKTGRMLHWIKTRKEYVKLTNPNGAFGTNHSLDIVGINPSTGRRVSVDNGKAALVRQETDNMYALSCGGRFLYLRQRFRGTQMIDLQTSNGYYVQQLQRWRDGGGYGSDVFYANGDINSGNEDPAIPETLHSAIEGHAPVAISGPRIFICESFGLVCLEKR